MAATIFRYDNAGHTIGILPYDSATHTEALDGTDKLVVVSEDSPTKRDRLVWQDESGLWHEHMVDATRRTHGAGGARTESTCSNSVNELYGVIVNGTKVRTRIEDVIAAILAGTTWYIGDCSNFGVVEMELYHKSARECLAELCELVRGELETFITVGTSGVTRRYLSIVRERGRKSVMRQFQYSRNISSIVREVTSDEVYTAVKGYGAKLIEYATSEYPERLEVVVTSNMDLGRWGVPMGNGTFAHSYTTYTDAQCTDKTFLTKQCKSVLSSVSKPLVRYEFDTVDAGDGLWSDVRLGDKVMCVDEQFNPSLELIERVSEIRRNLKGRMQCRIVIGARANPLVDKFKAAEKVGMKSTGNPSRVTAVSPVSTLGAGFDGEGAPGIGTPVVPPGLEPSSIAVTTPPTKGFCYKGDKIDYAGIEVTLYNGDGSVYTDEWHPDGKAIFEELVFPEELCPDGVPAEIDVPIYDDESIVTLSSIASIFGALNEAEAHTPGGVEHNAEYTKFLSLIQEYDGVHPGYVRINISDTWWSPGWGTLEVGYWTSINVGDTFKLGAPTWMTIIHTRASHDVGKPLVIVQSEVWGDDFQGRPFQGSYSQGGYYFVSTLNATNGGKVAEIPVQWVEPNSGRVLSASFQLPVMEKIYAGESWGGGEGISVPATSGGGKF